jgi:hypothetical protein
MMRNKQTKFTLITLFWIITIALTACGGGPESSDVPTMQETQPAANEENGTTPVTDNESMMMAFTECLREQGLDVADPIIDADGNIGKPAPVSGGEFEKGALEAVWEACEEHLEGFTAEEESIDISEQVDQAVALAACLRDRGYDVADPTAESLDQWFDGFKDTIDRDDPAAITDYEECSTETGGVGK